MPLQKILTLNKHRLHSLSDEDVRWKIFELKNKLIGIELEVEAQVLAEQHLQFDEETHAFDYALLSEREILVAVANLTKDGTETHTKKRWQHTVHGNTYVLKFEQSRKQRHEQELRTLLLSIALLLLSTIALNMHLQNRYQRDEATWLVTKSSLKDKQTVLMQMIKLQNESQKKADERDKALEQQLTALDGLLATPLPNGTVSTVDVSQQEFAVSGVATGFEGLDKWVASAPRLRLAKNTFENEDGSKAFSLKWSLLEDKYALD